MFTLLALACSSPGIDPGSTAPPSDDDTPFGTPPGTEPPTEPGTTPPTVTTPAGPFDDDLGLVCTPAVGPLAVGAAPVGSTPFLPTSNGFVSATYATAADGVWVTYTDGTSGPTSQRHQLASFSDHLPKNPTPTTTSRDRTWDAYWGVVIDGVRTWLNTVPEDSVAYEPGTGMVRVAQTVGGATVTTWWFAPFQAGGERDLVSVATVTWAGAGDHDVSLAVLHNAHTGGEGASSGESVTAGPGGAVVEARGGDRILHTPLGGGVATAGPSGDPNNPWIRLGAPFDGTLTSGDDVAVGFEWRATLSAGQSLDGGAVWSIDATDRTGFVAGRSPAEVRDAELDDWAAWHAADTLPAGLSVDEAAVAAQSLAVLRMAQVRAPGPGYGQLLASLPPGGWTISWPRDQAYATVALIRTGHLDEARDALGFVIAGDAGGYASLLGLDDYLVSVARYFGDGTEDSDHAWCPDGSDAGPNVELDDWGLFLWAFGELATASPGDALVTEQLDAVIAGVAEPLAALVDPANDLLVADSSIWERHWDSCFPNGRKQFVYSSLNAVVGLGVASSLGGDPDHAHVADRIRAGLLRFAADGGPIVPYTAANGQSCAFVASAPDETCAGCGPYDASVIELVNHGIVRPESTVARGTYDALRSHLAIGGGSPGFRRADDGAGSVNPYPWYDDQEWVVIDLRMAAAAAAIGRATGDPGYDADAEALLGWITDQATVNHGLIGELLSDGAYTPEDDADNWDLGADPGGAFQGAVPMVGFGAGAYLLALDAIRTP